VVCNMRHENEGSVPATRETWFYFVFREKGGVGSNEESETEAQL
jgi:hypothetical protein